MREDGRMTITEFLLARIEEDEAVARSIHARNCDTPAETILDTWGRPMSPVCDCDWHIARVLAECEAKRRIIDYREWAARESATTGLPIFEARLSAYDAALRALALPHADHPDHDESWRP